MLRLHWIFFVIIGGLGIVLAALISREQPDMTHVLYAWSIPFQLLFLTWLGARLLVLYERAEPPHRTKLKVSFAIAFCVLILGLGTAALLWDRSWLWLLAKSMVPAVGIVAVYSLPVARQSRVLWVLCAAGALYFAGGMAGALVGTEIGEKEAVGKARPPIESNGARA